MADEKPRFIHDCEECVFLGTYRGKAFEEAVEEEQDYDLYWCPQSGHPTLLARASDEVSDYWSGMVSGATGTVLPLAEAYKRAKARGLNCKEPKGEEE